MTPDTTSPFGAYKLGFRQALARKLALGITSKPLVNMIRAVGGLRSCKIADIEVYGGRMRVYPGMNRSDKVMLGTPHLFDKPERELLAQQLRSAAKPVFLDVGANIGAYSLFVKGLGLNAKIIAVEADPEIYARLKFNVPDNATLLNVAVADTEGTLPFYINDTNRGESSLVSGSGRKIDVVAKPMQQILRENSIDHVTAMKIDVEGAEESILLNMQKDMPQALWPEMVLIEHFHNPKTMNILEGMGYKAQLRTKLNAVMKRG